MYAVLYYFILLITITSFITSSSSRSEELGKNENLEDFPLDENDSSSDFLRQNNSSSDFLDRYDYPESTMESKQKIIFQRLIAEAMKKPGAYQTFAQVLPILRMMSPAQRLALAGMVMKQLTGETKEPFLEKSNRNDTMTAELMLPISMDVAKMFHGDAGSSLGRSTGGYDNFYPNRNAPVNFYRPSGTTIYPARRPPVQSNRRTVLEIPPEMRPPPPPPGLINPALRPPSPVLPANKLRPTLQIISPHRNNPQEPQPEDECKLVSSSLCSEVIDYPESEILESIESVSNKGAFNILLEDSRNSSDDFNVESQRSMERRISDDESLQVCSSSTTKIRPKRGKAVSGQWKFIVNTGEYTQTLRLEMCQKAKEPCSLLAENYQSECQQVFNYHRLVTWDKDNGLTMDIFRVPTCCSCHVIGMAFMRPPVKKYPIIEEFNEDNFVIDEEPLTPQRLPPPRLVPRKTPAHSTPKRESSFIRGRPTSSIQQDPEETKRIENQVRRTQSAIPKSKPGSEIRPPGTSGQSVSQTSSSKGGSIETLLAEVTQSTNSSSQNKAPSKRINYSYHPIIDFFKSSPPELKMKRRMDLDDWTPIDGPRSL